MENARNITRDEVGNSFFNVNDRVYKLPRLNWQYEEKFLIAMNSAGIDLMGGGEKVEMEVDLFTDQGTALRKTVIPWLFFESSAGNYTQLSEDYQLTHFSSIIEVYDVLAKAIEAVSYFLSQAQPSSQKNSNQSQAGASEKATTLKTPDKISQT